MGTLHPAAAVVAAALALSACGEAPTVDVIHGTPFVQALRPDDAAYDDSYRFDSTDDVVTFDSPGGGFRIHYTTAGRNAVPGVDTSGVSGVPDFVEDAAAIYDGVLAFYRDTLGFLTPLADTGVAAQDNDSRFDVYLVDFGGGGADGAFRVDHCLVSNSEQCIGYMVQENDFVGYGYFSAHIGNEILASHEFFHAIQAAYDEGQGPNLSEGTATWATEQYEPSLTDFEAAIDGYLALTDHSIDTAAPGPVNAFSYGTAVFFEFLTERFGDDVVRTLLERTVNGAGGEADPNWFTALPQLLSDVGGTTFADAWLEFATWNLYTSMFADPAKGYANGSGYPLVAMTTVTAPWTNSALRVAHSAAEYYKLLPAGRASMTAALVGPPDQLADLHLLLAVNVNNRWQEVATLSDLEAGDETVATDGARSLVIAVVNSATDATSRHPGICVGTTDEVAACKASLNGSTPPTDDTTGGDGCGCATTGAGAPWLLGLVAALDLRRRRGRAAPRQS